MRQVDTSSMKVNGWSKIFWASTEKKKPGVVVTISDEAKAKMHVFLSLLRHREGNYILIKGSIDNEEISVLSMYAPNGIISIFLKEKLEEVMEKIVKLD